MKATALLVGILLLALGLAGFVPALNEDGMLLGLLPMDSLRGVLFAMTGLAGIVVGLANRRELVPPHNPATHDLRFWM